MFASRNCGEERNVRKDRGEHSVPTEDSVDGDDDDEYRDRQESSALKLLAGVPILSRETRSKTARERFMVNDNFESTKY